VKVVWVEAVKDLDLSTSNRKLRNQLGVVG
jgi:hypothetical protein